METWKDIPGTLYSVSDEGRAASRRGGKWLVMKPGRNGSGYPQVMLSTDNGKRTRRVHQLVAEAFLGPRPTPRHQVNHRNGIRDDNRVVNLEWVTDSENKRHRFDVLKHGNVHGEQNGKAKLTEVQARDILARVVAGEAQKDVARDYKIHPTTVSDIMLGRSWRWLT